MVASSRILICVRDGKEGSAAFVYFVQLATASFKYLGGVAAPWLKTVYSFLYNYNYDYQSFMTFTSYITAKDSDNKTSWSCQGLW